MTSEERESLVTAYALNDPGLSSADREKIESLVAHDADVRQAVEETRQLRRMLTEGLAAEQAATPATAITIPASKLLRRRSPLWKQQVVAASLVLVAAIGVSAVLQSVWKAEHSRDGKFPAVAARGSSDEDVAIGYLNKSLLTGQPSDSDIHVKVKAQAETHYERLPVEDLIVPIPGRPSPLGGQGPPDGGKGKFNSGEYRPGAPRTPALVPPGLPSGPPRVTADLGRPVTAIPGSVPVAGNLPALPPGGNIDPTSPSESRLHFEAPPNANDRFPALVENAFIKVEGQNALSTFGVDVDTASYSIVRKFLSMGQMPPANAVRLEEMVNYFPYADKAPSGDDPFAVTVEMAECPWEPAHRLVRLGLKAKPIANEKRPASNLVFLIDVSGSMEPENRLPLVKASLKMLVNQLGENDRVAIVVYAGASGLVLDSTSAMKKEKILSALDNLHAGGSTNGEGGMHQAYEVAKANFIKGGTNRVILCTDGDWNVGTTSTEALIKMVEQKRETGVFLSVFGFGMGNLRDEMMVNLAGKGNGNYGYIDSLKEANKAFVEQMGGTLVTVAKDVKVQIEFNPAAVKSYRLLGYEKRILAAKDFHDDKKDAGEMGAGHVVTALYELVPTGAADPVVGKVDGLRYQKEADPKPAVKGDNSNEAFVVKMRHKKPDSDKSTLRELPVSNVTKQFEKTSEDFQFAAAVASFAMMLKDSPYKGSSNYGLVLELAASAKKREPGAHGEYRTEFIELVKKAKTLSGKP